MCLLHFSPEILIKPIFVEDMKTFGRNVNGKIQLYCLHLCIRAAEQTYAKESKQNMWESSRKNNF